MKKPKRDPVKSYLAEIGRKGWKVLSEKKLEHLKKARAIKAVRRKLYANNLVEKWRRCEEKEKKAGTVR